jgi:hypothetical protein
VIPLRELGVSLLVVYLVSYPDERTQDSLSFSILRDTRGVSEMVSQRGDVMMTRRRMCNPSFAALRLGHRNGVTYSARSG